MLMHYACITHASRVRYECILKILPDALLMHSGCMHSGCITDAFRMHYVMRSHALRMTSSLVFASRMRSIHNLFKNSLRSHYEFMNALRMHPQNNAGCIANARLMHHECIAHAFRIHGVIHSHALRILLHYSP